jgi:hypothetical protein
VCITLPPDVARALRGTAADAPALWQSFFPADGVALACAGDAGAAPRAQRISEAELARALDAAPQRTSLQL